MKYIAAEEEWLRLLVHELTPVIEHLHADELPLSESPFLCSPGSSLSLVHSNPAHCGILRAPLHSLLSSFLCERHYLSQKLFSIHSTSRGPSDELGESSTLTL